MSRHLLAFVLGGIAAAALSVSGVSAFVSAGSDTQPHVRVATFVDGRCGKLGDSLPALVSRNDAKPGDVVGDVTVCVKSAGEDSGTLSLRALELVDVEAACTGDEATRDNTCEGSAAGELAASLLQQVGLATCPSVPSATNPALDRRLPSLQENPLVLATRLRPEQVTCVRLRLRYEPPTTDARVASQSDRTSWRYEFSLVSR